MFEKVLLAQDPTRGIYNPLIPSSQVRSVSDWLPKAISAFATLFILIGFIAMFFYFLFGGIMWITSGGDQKRVEGASKQITNAIIGMVIAAAGWAIISILDKFFGLRILENGIRIPTL